MRIAALEPSRSMVDPAHFIMDRKMMLEIKRRAEGRLPGLPAAA